MAEREGFEPSVWVYPIQRISSPPPSATRPPFQNTKIRSVWMCPGGAARVFRPVVNVCHWHTRPTPPPFQKPETQLAHSSTGTGGAQPKRIVPKSSRNFQLTDLGAWKTPEIQKSSGSFCRGVGLATFHTTFSSLRGAWRPSGTVIYWAWKLFSPFLRALRPSR